ncbi:MAG: alpha/beta fold hydrolase BchO, partial [Pseudomonadota bacterium]
MVKHNDDLVWERDGASWPLSQHSRFVESEGLRWHVQIIDSPGAADASPETLALIHGTGSTTHSWAAVAPLLANTHRVVMMDLPGHGFTAPLSAHAISLPGYARRVATLLRDLDLAPTAVVGHSAGAAIAVRMALDGVMPASARRIIGLNAALLPFPGPAATLFPFLARLLFTNALVPRLFARRGQDREAVARLLASTGSTLDDDAIARYARLFRSPVHVKATLDMMAYWDLAGLARAMPRLACPLLLAAGGLDQTVSPERAYEAAKLTPQAHVELVPKLGHLMQEEDPQQLA